MIDFSQDNLRDLKERTEDGYAPVPFIGAGISKAIGLPLWSDLLLSLVGLEHGQEPSVTQNLQVDLDVAKAVVTRLNNSDYLGAAELAKAALGEAAFFRRVRSALRIRSNICGPAKLLPKWPSTLIVTTNYDFVIEEAFREDGIPLRSEQVIVGADVASLANAANQKKCLLKIHGTLDRCDTWVCTRSDYERYYGRNPAFVQIVSALFLQKTFLFLGYGLEEGDIIFLLKHQQRLFHGNAGPHYAILPWNRRDALSELNQLGIAPIWYSPSDKSHSEVYDLFKHLHPVLSDHNDHNIKDSSSVTLVDTSLPSKINLNDNVKPQSNLHEPTFNNGKLVFQGGEGPLTLDVGNKISSLVTGSFWEPYNEERQRNSEVVQSLLKGDIRWVHHLSRVGLSIVVDELITDLNFAANDRSQIIRFVCTNTTVEALGILSWAEESALRKLVAGTAGAMKISCRLECWRVFLINSPKSLLSADMLMHMYAIVEENREIGIITAFACRSLLDPRFSQAYADFYCIPGSKVFLSTTPYYLLSRFSQERTEDKILVDYFSEMAEYLIDCAINSSCDGCSRWEGGTMSDLKTHMEKIDSANKGINSD